MGSGQSSSSATHSRSWRSRRCWAAEAVARPAFAKIVEELSELYAQEEAGLEPEPELGGSE
jgi:hypothetical protein